MHDFVGKIVAFIGNWFLTILRNRVDLSLTRDEFRFSRIGFSLFGEDRAVLHWLDERLSNVTPIYVDAGCFHPILHSNTLLLYKRGWRGFNIDMSPAKIAAFNRLRPDDINIVAALSSAPGEMFCFEYQNSGGPTDRLGGIDQPNLQSTIGEISIAKKRVQTTTLDRILTESKWPIERIGYLNIDCEGHDREVLKGLNLDRYRPAIITIEANSPEEKMQTTEYLSVAGYTLEEVLFRTLLFVRMEAQR